MFRMFGQVWIGEIGKKVVQNAIKTKTNSKRWNL